MGSKIEKLIKKNELRLTIDNDLAEKPQFSTNFSQKSNKHSSTILLPWKQWVSHETHMCLKRFSTAEGETWLWVDSAPPALNRVKAPSRP